MLRGDFSTIFRNKTFAYKFFFHSRHNNGFYFTRLHVARNLAHVFAATATFYVYDAQTKIITNFASNIFCGCIFSPRGCYFRVTGGNAKFGSIVSIKIRSRLSVGMLGEFCLLKRLKIFSRMSPFCEMFFSTIEAEGGGRKNATKFSPFFG